MVKVQDIKKQYRVGEIKVNALNGANLEVNEGEFVAIMGSSGSGKSTLMNIIGGIDGPTEGKIWIDGKCISTMNDTDITIFRRTNIGFVFQSFNLMPTLTVQENIALPLLISGKTIEKYAYKINTLIDLVGLKGREHHKPSQLSGGQQQRVAIARAFVTEPKIILLDEPTGALDSKNGEIILELLTDVQKKYGVTIIMVTHSVFAAEHADKVIFLKDGIVVDSIIKEKNNDYSAKTINDKMLCL